MSAAVFAVPTSLAHLLRSCDASPYSLPNTQNGHYHHSCFATMARLVTCLVNERLASACCVTTQANHEDVSFLIVSGPSSCDGSLSRMWAVGSFIFQLRHVPVLNNNPDEACWANVRRVAFLDPDDLGVWAWRTCSVDIPQGRWTGTVTTCPLELLSHVGRWNSLSPDDIDALGYELDSSMAHQQHAYAHRHELPDLDLAKSSTIDWEQSIVEGHATHPMHRARYAVPPLLPFTPETEFRHLPLRFVAVPRSQMIIQGDYDELLAPLFAAATSTDALIADSAASISGEEKLAVQEQQQKSMLDFVDLSTEVVVPVHPLHLLAVTTKFPFARVLPFESPAEAQASLRTVSPLALADQGLDIKLPLGAKTTSALRTVSTWSAHLGPRLAPYLRAMASGLPGSAPLVAEEPASIIVSNPDNDVAKYLACIVRLNAQRLCVEQSEHERAVLAAALTERDEDGHSVVCKKWRLDTVEKRQVFLRKYADKLFAAFLPPLLSHGFAFEAHQQNTLVRFDSRTGDPVGFVIRDFGGIMVHEETFRKATGGMTIPMLDGSSTTAADPDELYGLSYHTLIQCQIHRLVRALELHYSGNGWQIVREAFDRAVPGSCALRDAWMRKEVKLKSFVSMKLGGLYRDYVYTSVPNILLYQDEEHGIAVF
ncbi:hypothetical protein GGI12_004417 [Dipsacomyces acuminosporus]|nr:hypothetical protein GGI12_004417 [Dipsacomyces acuminosporus]